MNRIFILLGMTLFMFGSEASECMKKVRKNCAAITNGGDYLVCRQKAKKKFCQKEKKKELFKHFIPVIQPSRYEVKKPEFKKEEKKSVIKQSKKTSKKEKALSLKEKCISLGYQVSKKPEGIFASRGPLRLIATSVDEIACKLGTFKTIVLGQLFSISYQENKDRKGLLWPLNDKVKPFDLEKKYQDSNGNDVIDLIRAIRKIRGSESQIYMRTYATADNFYGAFVNHSEGQNHDCSKWGCPNFLSHLKAISTTLGRELKSIDGVFIEFANEYFIHERALGYLVRQAKEVIPGSQVILNIMDVDRSQFRSSDSRHESVIKADQTPVMIANQLLNKGDGIYIDGLFLRNGVTFKTVEALNDLQITSSKINIHASFTESAYIPPLNHPEYLKKRAEKVQGLNHREYDFADYRRNHKRLAEINGGYYRKVSDNNDELKEYSLDRTITIVAEDIIRGTKKVSASNKLCVFLGNYMGFSNSPIKCLDDYMTVECHGENYNKAKKIVNDFKLTSAIYHEAKLGAWTGQIMGCPL